MERKLTDNTQIAIVESEVCQQHFALRKPEMDAPVHPRAVFGWMKGFERKVGDRQQGVPAKLL
jgi:hypothetical protein